MSASVMARGTLIRLPPKAIVPRWVRSVPEAALFGGQMRATIPRQRRRSLASRMRDLDGGHRAM